MTDIQEEMKSRFSHYISVDVTETFENDDVSVVFGYFRDESFTMVYGSFLDAMADGIERASGLILGVSQFFNTSPHCRQEVKYAYLLGIPFFPLLLEPNFRAESWLGVLLAGMSCVELFDESMASTAMHLLKNQLGDLGHKSRSASKEASEFLQKLNRLSRLDDLALDESDVGNDRLRTNVASNDKNRLPVDLTAPAYVRSFSSSSSSSYASASSTDPPLVSTDGGQSVLSDWNTDKVISWLNEGGLSVYSSHFSHVDGPMLVQMARMRITALDALSNSLHRDMNMDLVDQLKLYKALARLPITLPNECV